MNVAEWRIKGYYKADAQKVCDEIGDRAVTKENVLEIARDENTELHKCFEWNDGIAAEKYRLCQAQKIIQNLVIKRVEPQAQPLRYYSITQEKGVYAPTRSFLVKEDEYDALLRKAKAELEAFRKKYETLSELEQVFEQIDLITA